MDEAHNISRLIQSATGDNGQDLSLINHGHGSLLGTRVGPEFPTTGTGLETLTIKTFPVLGFTSQVLNSPAASTLLLALHPKLEKC